MVFHEAEATTDPFSCFWGKKKSFGGLIGVEMELLGPSCRSRFYCSNLTEQLHYCFPPLSHISQPAGFANMNVLLANWLNLLIKTVDGSKHQLKTLYLGKTLHRIKRVQCHCQGIKGGKRHHKAILISAEITGALEKAVLFSNVKKVNIFSELSGF